MNERRMSLGNRILSLVLALVMVFGMLPTGLFAFTAKAADSATAGNVATIRQYAAQLLKSNFSNAASEDSESKDDKFTWDTEGKKTNWRYYNGVMLDALLMLGVDSDTDDTVSTDSALEFAKDFMDTNTEDADKAVTHYITKEVDSVPPALVLFDLLDSAEVTDADRAIYEKAIHYVYNQLAAQTKYTDCGGNFLHKMDNDSWKFWNIGLDGIYMAQPFLMEYADALKDGRITNSSVKPEDIYRAVYERLMWVADNMYDSTTGLYHHGYTVAGGTYTYDEKEYEFDAGSGNGVFWSRGIGWYATGLVMCIDLMPEGTYKTDLIAKAKKLFDGMLPYQDSSTGMWYNIVNTTSTVSSSNSNRLETSGSALMAFAMMKAYNEGWVTDAKYATAAEKAFNGIVSNKLSQSDGVITIKDTYQSSGVGVVQSYYCTSSYKNDEAKGVGPVIMAASEMAKYIGGTETFTTGVVVAPNITTSVGVAPDYSGVKITLVGSNGTIKNVPYTAVTFAEVAPAAVEDAAGEVTVYAIYDNSVIDTFTVTVVDTESAKSNTGTVSIETGEVTVPDAPTFSAGNFEKIKDATTGSDKTTYTRIDSLSNITSGDSFVIVESSKKVALKNNNVEKAVQAAGTISGDTWEFTTVDDAPYSIFTLTGSDGVYTASNCNDGSTTWYIYNGSSGKVLNTTSNQIRLIDTDSNTANTFNIQLNKDANNYLSISSNNWSRSSGSGSYFYLFKVSASGEGTPAVYAQLTGSEGLVYTLGTEADTISTAIKASETFKVLVGNNSDGTKTDGSAADELAMSDSLVTVEASSDYSTTTAGTYNFIVKYNGVQIGTVPVTVYDDSAATTDYDVTLTVTPENLVVEAGKNASYTAEATISGLEGYTANICYSTPDSEVATADGNVITGVAAGTTTVVVSVNSITKGTDTIELSDPASVTLNITVNAPAAEEPHVHDYTAVEDPEATCTTAGTRTYTCSCGASYTETVPALGHNYVDGVCTRCSAADPDAGTPVETTPVATTTPEDTTAPDDTTGSDGSATGNIKDYTGNPPFTPGDYVEIVAPSTSTTGGSSTDYTAETSNTGWQQTVVGSSDSGSTVEYVLYSSEDNDSVPTGNYIIVYSTNGTSGKALTNVTSDVSGGTVPATPTDVTIAGGKITSTINGYIVWTVGDDSYVGNGNNYLQDGQNEKLLNKKGNANAISFAADSGTTDGWLIYLQSGRPMGWGSSNNFERLSGGTGVNVFLFKETPVESTDGAATESEYAKLVGTATYSLDTASNTYTLDTLLDQIQEDYKIHTSTTNSGDGTAIAWSDDYCEWEEGADLTKAGEYTLTITYKDKTLGTITVAVNTTTEGTTTTVPGVYAKLDGTEGLSCKLNVASTDIINNYIKKSTNLKVLVAEDANGTNVTELAMSDSKVLVAKQTDFSKTTAGTYYFDVFYDYDEDKTADSNEKIGSVPVYVNGEATLAVSPSSATVAVNGTQTLTPAVTVDGVDIASGKYVITWNTSDSGVATVTDGVVTGVATGNVTITATLTKVTVTSNTDSSDAVENTLDTPISVQIPVTVSGEVAVTAESVALSYTSKEVENGGTVDLSDLVFTVTYSNGSTKTFKQGDTGVTIDTADIEKIDTAVAGDYSVDVKYVEGDYTYNGKVTITVKEATGSDTPSTGSTYIHNFTTNDKNSSFYTIAGSLSTSKGSASYNDLDLTQCLKMNGDAQITFESAAAGTITMVFNTGSAGKKIDVNGTIYTIPSDGIVTAYVSAGDNTIVRNDGESFLYYMAFAEDSGLVVYSLSDLTFNPSAIKVGESTTVTSSGVASDGSSHTYTIVYSVDDTNKATVDGTTITGKAAGEVTVTAKLTHVDGTELTSPATKTATLTINPATVESGKLNSESATVVKGTDVTLSALSATITYSDGTTATLNLNESGFTFKENGSDITITNVDATVGTHTIAVYYDGVSIGNLTVTVTEPVTETAAVTYVLDTDGIDDGEEYIIVDYLDGTPYAFGHSGSTTEKAFAVTVNGNKVTIDEKNLSGALWKFTAQTTANYYNINSGNYYIKDGGNTLLSTDSTKTVQVVASDSVSGGYLVNLGSASTPQYMYIASASDWKRNSGDEHVVYLYKKTESSDSITIEEVPTLQIGGTASHTLNITEVKYGGSVIEAGNYTVVWTSQDTLVATVTDGVVNATGAGTTQLVATLETVNGEEVTKEVIGAVTVAVQIPSIELGDNQTLFVNDTLTLTPEVELGGATPESYTIEWTSSNPDMVSVDENGKITALAATGETPVTIVARLRSVNDHEEVYNQNYYDTIDVTVDTVRIVSGQLSSNTVTVAVTDNTEEGAAAVQDAIKDITLTLTKNNGDTVTVDHATLFEDVDLAVVDTTQVGTYNVSVSYEDPDSDYIFAGIVSVKVIDPDLLDQEGIITVETNVTYEIDTDGIDANEEYVIVCQNSDEEWVALMNPDATATGNAYGSSQVVTRSDDGNTITISENANLVRWLFVGSGTNTQGDYTYVTFTSVSNNNRLLSFDNDKVVQGEGETIYTYLDGGKYFIGGNVSSKKLYALYLNGDSWQRSDSRTTAASTDYYYYLYKKVGTGTDYGVGFSVTPTEKTLATGTSFTVPESGISVQVGEDWASSYKIEWSTSDSGVATVDSNGKITGVSAGTVTITATLVEANGEKVTNNSTNEVGIAKTITVKVVNDTIKYTVLGSPLTVPLGGEPDFSKISLFMDSTYADDMTISSDELVIKYIDAVTKGFDTNTAGATCEVDVYYNNEKVGVVVVNVADNVYEGLDEATSYPEYPSTGAVRADKTATGINFNATGVAKIELNAAGVSSRNPVDVILIVDVSNSMAWTEGTNTYSVTDNKLLDAMAAATDFADILFSSNVTDSDTNNTITFVTFGGHDKEVGGDGYTDAMMTVFVGEDSLTDVSTSFAGTKFTGEKNLTIAGVDGNALNDTSKANRGNTNYDLGFAQAMDAVEELKIAKAGSVEEYDAGNREVHVVFMTDGAPSHYNGYRFDNTNSSGGFSNFSSDLNGDDAVDKEDWLLFIQNHNEKATDLYAMVDDFHIVGFDLAHGGFGDHTWSEAELGRVLGGLVQNKALDYTLASDTDKLKVFFTDLGHSLAYAGTQALVTDIVSEHFILQTDPIDLYGDGSEMLAPTIEIVERRLVEASDIGSTLNIEGVGSVEVSKEHVGMHVVGGEEILATVTFDTNDPNDLKAYSTALDGSEDIWDDETNIITGKYFTYAFGTKTFEWKIGNIEDTEIALTYYGYLDGSMEGNTDHGVYATNEKATLKYINTDNQVVTREYPVPQVAFGSAVVNVRFFLVDKDGNFVNRAGVIFTNPANRIFLVNSAAYQFNLNTDLDSLVPGTFTTEDAFVNAGLSSQYTLYDDVTINVTNSTSAATKPGSAVIASGKDKDKTDALVEFIDVYGDGSYIQTTINIPVILVDLGESDQKMSDSHVVIDFSNPVQWDALTTERAYDGITVDELTYTIELVGFAKYNPNADLKDYLPETEWATELSTDYGTYKVMSVIDDDPKNPTNGIDDVIQFTPKAMLSGTDHVFAVFKFENTHKENTDTEDYYYMYKLISVVPATVVHYETTGDMANAFTSVNGNNSWSEAVVTDANGNVLSAASGATQSNANEQYGYDESYASCSYFAGGSSWYVENTGTKNGPHPSVAFSFTGTGIDIISKTGKEQGLIRMTLVGRNTGMQKAVMVINKGVDELYQIPVLSVEGLPYDTYDAEIVVYNKSSAYGGQFHFDAIRVYGAALESEVIGSTTASDTTVGSLYEAAGESSPQIIEIRDILLGNNDFGNISASGIEKAAVYVDGNQSLGEGSTNFNDYDKIGPNNEVYLSNNQAVAFKLKVNDVNMLPESLDIGLKSVNGSVNATVYVITGTGDNAKTYSYTHTVGSATAMFYDILTRSDGTTDKVSDFLGNNQEFTVVIANKDTNGTILSVTDLKVGYGATKGKVDTVVDIDVGTDASTALASTANVVSVDIANMDTVTDSDTGTETDVAVAYAMYTTTVVVVTGQDAQSIKIVDNEGNELAVSATFVDSDKGARRWRVLVRFNEVGEKIYTVSAIGSNGNPGATKQITVDVRLFEGTVKNTTN